MMLTSPKFRQLTRIPPNTESLPNANYAPVSFSYDPANLYGSRSLLVSYKANDEEAVFGTGILFDTNPSFQSSSDFWAVNISSGLYRPLTTGIWSAPSTNVRAAPKVFAATNRPGARHSAAACELPGWPGHGVLLGGQGAGETPRDQWVLNFSSTSQTIGFTYFTLTTWSSLGARGAMSELYNPDFKDAAVAFVAPKTRNIFVYFYATLWKIDTSNHPTWLMGWISGAVANGWSSTTSLYSEVDNEYGVWNFPGFRYRPMGGWLTDDILAICGGYAETTELYGLMAHAMDIWLYNITSNMWMFKGASAIGSAGRPGTKDVYSDTTRPRGRSNAFLMAISPTKMLLYGGGTTVTSASVSSTDYTSSEAYVIGIYSCYGRNVLDPLACAGAGKCVGQDKCVCNPVVANQLQDCSTGCFGDALNSSSQCSGHGSCRSVDSCSCLVGYSGSRCEEWSCSGIPRTSLGVCSGAGSCVSSNTCSCQQRFGGNNCEDYGCFGVAITNTSHVCSSHGVCVTPDSCRCDENYFGENCQTFGCNGLSKMNSEVCGGFGICVLENKCECRSGHFGPWCETFGCSGVSAYNTSGTCNGHGLCVGENTCRCDGNHFGDDCEIFGCANISSTHKNVCSGRGKCVAENVCVCDDQSLWQGVVCEQSTQLSETISSVTIGVVISGIVGVALAIILVTVIVLLCVTRKLRRFQKIKDIDLLVAESEMHDMSTTPKIAVDKDFFKINAMEISVIKKIGSGGSGTSVWLAKWQGRNVAYKTFSFDQSNFIAFETELKLMMSLLHPNILSCFGAVLQDSLAGYLMEFASNGDLLSFVTRDNVSQKERKRLLSEAASALVLVHRHNIIHRDIKAENILVSEDRHAKLMDFGVSRAIKTTDATKTAKVGTSTYMAPEVTLGNTYTLQADVFSFAILIWVVMVGRDDPYNMHMTGSLSGNAGVERLVAHNSEMRPSSKEFEDVCHKDVINVELVKRMWDTEPEKRPTMQEVFFELSKN